MPPDNRSDDKPSLERLATGAEKQHGSEPGCQDRNGEKITT
jgi:hypothetical protein